MIDKLEKIIEAVDFNLWFIRLRWIACAVALVLVIITVHVFHYLDDENFWTLLILILILGTINLIYFYFVKKNIFLKHLKEIQIVADLIILTLLLHFSGGIENPLSFLYLFHVILSGILLSKKKSYITVAFTFGLYFSLAMTELYADIPHYTLKIFPHQAYEEHTELSGNNQEHNHGSTEIVHASHYAPYVWSISILNLFMMLLTAYFITNIMERLRSEEIRTRIERQRLEKVLQATNAGLVIMDRNLNIIWFNEPVILLLDLEDVEKTKLKDVLNEWVTLHSKTAAQTLQDGLIRSLEREYIDKSGQKQYFQITVAPLFDENGEIYQVVELFQNISMKKYVEAEMLHSAKMLTLGTMAAGIAHEVGNPLASISTRLELMANNAQPEFISKSIHLLKKEISRIDRIVRGISQFGRTSKEEWKICDINKILSETIEMLKYHKVGKGSQIVTEFENNLPLTFAVGDQLKQIFLNLGLNALEAMPNGGTFKIVTKQEEGYVRITFSDTGRGIPNSDLSKIFQPFYTTKESGSGLGLFIVNHLIEAHGGKIDVKSVIGEGTEFIITLPIYYKSEKIRIEGD